jgi:hypothetical protein
MCRVAILGILDKEEVPVLPLPKILKTYLTYDANPDFVDGYE